MTTTQEPVHQPLPPETPNSGFLFMAFLFLVVLLVIWLGVFNYKEALKTESSKSNGEALVAWLTETGLKRFDADSPHDACKGGVKPATNAQPGEPVPGTWGPCFSYLMAKTENKELINPFFNEAPKLIPQCIPSDRSTMGAFMIENLVATPPGSANPLVISPISDTTPIDTKLQLRMSVCDKGGYAIKISEFDF